MANFGKKAKKRNELFRFVFATDTREVNGFISILYGFFGRAPWSAADALVGLFHKSLRLILLANSGSRGPMRTKGSRSGAESAPQL